MGKYLLNPRNAIRRYLILFVLPRRRERLATLRPSPPFALSCRNTSFPCQNHNRLKGVSPKTHRLNATTAVQMQPLGTTVHLTLPQLHLLCPATPAKSTHLGPAVRIRRFHSTTIPQPPTNHNPTALQPQKRRAGRSPPAQVCPRNA